MKQKRFRLEDSYKPTIEEIAENRRVIELYDYYGIRTGFDVNYTKDEIKAMRFINKNKNLPKELAKRLLDTRNEKISIIESSITSTITEEEAFEMFGIPMVK